MLHALLPAIAPALPLASPAPTEAHTLRLAPAAGAYTRTYRARRAFEGGDMSVLMDGREVPKMFLPDLAYESEQTLAVTLTDTHGEGHRRTLDEGAQGFRMDMTFGAESGMEPASWEGSARTPLAGHAVRFVPSEEGAVEARWDAEEGRPDPRLLEGLEHDVHGAGLLPGDPVEVDDEWEADGAALRAVLHPGGDLAWSWDTGEDPTAVEAVRHGGALELRLVEVVEEDGLRLARVELGGTLVETNTRATDLEEVPVADGAATETTTTTYDVEGELLWDLDRHVLHSLELEGEGEGTQETVKDPGQAGGDYVQTLRHTAKLELVVG